MYIFSFQGMQCREAPFQVLINSDSFCNHVMLMICMKVNGNANFWPVFFYLCFSLVKGRFKPSLILSSLAMIFIKLNSTTFKCYITPKGQLWSSLQCNNVKNFLFCLTAVKLFHGLFKVRGHVMELPTCPCQRPKKPEWVKQMDGGTVIHVAANQIQTLCD